MCQYSAGFLIQYLRLNPTGKKLEKESVQFKLHESREESVMSPRQCSEPCRQNRSIYKRSWSMKGSKGHTSTALVVNSIPSCLSFSLPVVWGSLRNWDQSRKKKASLFNNVQKQYGHGSNRTSSVRWWAVLVSILEQSLCGLAWGTMHAISSHINKDSPDWSMLDPMKEPGLAEK